MQEWFSRLAADPGWEMLGLAGQLSFGSRFLYQWIVSERAKRSTVPVGFWWLSIVGSILIFIYAIHQASLTFMIPTIMGLPVYARNLVLIRREKINATGGGHPAQ